MTDSHRRGITGLWDFLCYFLYRQVVRDRICKGPSWRILLIGLVPIQCLTEASGCLYHVYCYYYYYYYSLINYLTERRAGRHSLSSCFLFLWVNGEGRRQFNSCLCNYNNIYFYSITHRTISHLFAALVEGCSAPSLYKFPKQHLIHYYIITCDDH